MADEAPYDAIFFDMDGTLLPMPVRRFLEAYYETLDEKLHRAGMDAELFVHALNRGMHAMSEHSPEETNSQAFWRTFAREHEEEESPLNAQQMQRAREFLLDFYRNEFEACGRGIVVKPQANRVVAHLHAKGYPLYLTTMPLFPLEGVLPRLRWAGVNPAYFARITTFDNSTAVKPQLAFYYENLAIAGAAELIDSWLPNGMPDSTGGKEKYRERVQALLERLGFDVDSVKHGSLLEFEQWACELPPCHSRRALEGYPNRSPLDGGLATERGREAKPVALWDESSKRATGAGAPQNPRS